MYAVIRTGGKQYKVQAGDLLVVEKIAGDAGADVSFGDVLMLGDGGVVTVGAPTVDGASVSGTLIETRKGEKIKVFKKTRRQGYRRTGGHRQIESVVRVTSVAGGGKTDKWDGVVDLTTKAVLDARARNLTDVVALLEGTAPAAKVQPAKVVTKAKAAPAPKADVVAEAAPAAEAKAPAAKKAAAPKAEATGETKAKAPAKKAAPKADKE
jgi:large subunit ribosomal protein L21